jgi:hypothetical protein
MLPPPMKTMRSRTMRGSVATSPQRAGLAFGIRAPTCV